MPSNEKQSDSDVTMAEVMVLVAVDKVLRETDKLRKARDELMALLEGKAAQQTGGRRHG